MAQAARMSPRHNMLNCVVHLDADMPRLASDSASLEIGLRTGRSFSTPTLLNSVSKFARLGNLASFPSPSYSGSQGRPDSGMVGAFNCRYVAVGFLQGRHQSLRVSYFLAPSLISCFQKPMTSLADVNGASRITFFVLETSWARTNADCPRYLP